MRDTAEKRKRERSGLGETAEVRRLYVVAVQRERAPVRPTHSRGVRLQDRVAFLVAAGVVAVLVAALVGEPLAQLAGYLVGLAQ